MRLEAKKNNRLLHPLSFGISYSSTTEAFPPAGIASRMAQLGSKISIDGGRFFDGLPVN